MSVLNPRNRLVNFRLSQEEFEKLKAACSEYGARSVSDFARSSVLRSLEQFQEVSCGRACDLEHKVVELEARVEQLLRLVTAVSGESPERPAGVPVIHRIAEL
jgi:hypothetical protein